MKISSVRNTGIKLLRFHVQSEGTVLYKWIFRTVNTNFRSVRIKLHVSAKIISHYSPNYGNKKEDFTDVLQV
jgi:hypothetical protein